jgi:hypothetical protein
MHILGCDAMLILPAEKSLRIERNSQVRITCLSGLLWVTQEGDLRDLFALPEESLEFKRGGVVLITALEPSVVSTCEIPARLLSARLFDRLSCGLRQAVAACMGLRRCS